MARQPVITRTITTTIADFLAVRVDTKSTETVTLTLPRTYKDEQAMLKMANKRGESSQLKYVAVISTPVVKKKRWGMTEEDFIDKGYEFPPYKTTDDAGSETDADTDIAEFAAE